MKFDPSALDDATVLAVPFAFTVDGAATDATSVVLADACGRYGVRRRDTGEAVVPAGRAMTRTGVGTYTASFGEPDWGLTYEAAVQVVYAGQTYQYGQQVAGTPAPQPSAAGMVALLKTALRNNPVGLVTVNVDGQQVTYGRAEALDELRFWQREAALAAGTRRRAASVRLDRF